MMNAVGMGIDGYACRKLGSAGVREQEACMISSELAAMTEVCFISRRAGVSQQSARLSSQIGMIYGKLEYLQSTQLLLSRYHAPT